MRGLEEKRSKLAAELSKYADFDPELVQKIKDDVKTCREAIERWNDNIYTLMKIFKENFHMPASEFNKQFGLPEELDI
jgi:Leucine zipper with capping helix domain